MSIQMKRVEEIIPDPNDRSEKVFDGNQKVFYENALLFGVKKRGDMPGYWARTSDRKSGSRFIDKIHLNEGAVLVIHTENKTEVEL